MFNKQTLGRVVVPLTYLEFDQETGDILTDEEGKQKTNRCVFVMRRRLNAEAKADEMTAAVGSRALGSLDRLGLLLVEAPTGFRDFPLTAAEFQARFKDELREVAAGTEVAEIAAGMGVPIDERPLAERAREYFSDPDAQIIVSHAMGEYYRRALPVELFQAG